MLIDNTGTLLAVVITVAEGEGLFGSVAVTEAVFVILPLYAGSAVPVTVKIILFAAPAGILAIASSVFPVPVAPEMTEADPCTTEVHTVLTIFTGIASCIWAAMASLGPVLPMVMT